MKISIYEVVNLGVNTFGQDSKYIDLNFTLQNGDVETISLFFNSLADKRKCFTSLKTLQEKGGI